VPVDDPRRFGIVELEGEIVSRLVEKPQTSLSNLGIAGVYLIQNGGMLKKAIDHIIAQGITTKNEYQLTDALQVMVEWGEKFKVIDIEHCLDCGTRRTLIETNATCSIKISNNRRQCRVR
jgi:glucose-1-phosphate thymidylyltransferase